MQNLPKQPYEDMRSDMRTGDILLFAGTGFISRAIQRITDSEWSHVGMVLNVEEFDFVCCFESTTLSNIPDLTTGAKVRGVSLVPLSQRLASYDGRVAWRRLEGQLGRDQVQEALRMRSKFTGTPYEGDQLELLKSALDNTALGQNQPDLSSVFCSELVAETLKAMDVLGTNIFSNEYTPADFADPDEIDLLSGYTYRLPVQLT